MNRSFVGQGWASLVAAAAVLMVGSGAAAAQDCGTLGENIASQDTHPMPPNDEEPGPILTQEEKEALVSDRPPGGGGERGTCSGSGLGLFYPFDVNNTAGWTLALARGDDNSSVLINLGFTFQFYGTSTTSCYINNNGNITFGAPYGTYVPTGFPSATVPAMIAPFWADVDTRNTATGRVWYKIIDSNNGGALDTLIVTWDDVGYFNQHADLLNTFQLVISNFTNPQMPNQSNVCFDYDNMCWTTGDINGVGGFTDPPSATTGNAVVGINRSNGTDYFQIGRFGENNSSYDGPFGGADGVSYLDNRRFCFNTQTGNVPPIPANLPANNTYNIAAGQTLNAQIQFLSPEFGQTTTITYLDQDAAIPAGLVLVPTAGNLARLDLDWVTSCSDVGTYTVIVTARDNFNPQGVTIVTLTININEVNTLPTVALTEPDSFECICDNFIIRGTATGTNFNSYVLEYSTLPAGPYTLITSSTVPVVNGILGTWDTTPIVSQNYYYLRLRASNDCGPSAQAFVLVFVDKIFDSIVLRRPPVPNSIIGGNDYCIDGTVNENNCFTNYRVDFAPPPFVAFGPVNPAMPVYTAQVSTDPLASWDTLSGPGSVADGTYRLRILGTNACGTTGTVTRDVIVDNTAPVANIRLPNECTYQNGVIPVIGTASDAHLAGWVLMYTGGDASGWVTIASGNTNVFTALLANWDTTGLRNCAYTLRLIVTDQSVLDCNDSSRNQSEYTASIIVGCPGDLDFDGQIALSDLALLLSQFGTLCP